jgi:SAM-dependent methyltransferase
MSPRRFLWIATKNAIHPFRRLLSWHRQRRNEQFDRRVGVRTSGTVSLEDLGLSPEKSIRYEATPIRFFHAVLGKLRLDYPKTVFIDLGCGKGRALLLASHYPFRSIIGVEISEMLCEAAGENIKGYRSKRQVSSEISVVCSGIEEFEYHTITKSDHVLVYLFNPCGESVLAAGLQKLSCLVSQGISVTIIYLNPVWVKLLETAAWLQEIRRGETFDDSASSFMPYAVFRSLPLRWANATETLVFQFGPWVFARWTFVAASNATNPLLAQGAASERPPILTPTTYRQLRDDGTFSDSVSLGRKVIRYVTYRGRRYFVDLSNGSFDDYLAKFSKKTRGNLKRQVRHFAEHCGNKLDLRFYSTSDDILEFRRQAIAISVLTYQQKIGFGFAESEMNLIDEAAKGRVCGFVLMDENKPISYAFCRINSDIITYTLPGYDPKFAHFSPGTVLLFLMLERLFGERKFRLFDFGGQEWGYKALFATGFVDYVRVIWFPITTKNLVMVTAHYLVGQAWRGAARLKRFGAHCTQSARALAERRAALRSTATLYRASPSGERIDVPKRSRAAPSRTGRHAAVPIMKPSGSDLPRGATSGLRPGRDNS